MVDRRMVSTYFSIMAVAEKRFLQAVITSASVIVFLFLPFVPGYPIEVGSIPQAVEDKYLPDGDRVTVKAWVTGLEVPWSLVFLPDGRALVSERPGRIRLIRDGALTLKPYAAPDAAAKGEGGLMGLAVHPKFPAEPYIYAMYTYREKGEVYNKVVRLRDEGDKGSIDKTIIDRIAGGRFHDGGRIAFGPDGMLYITTGEIFEGKRAQDPTSLNGKILRVSPDGAIPKDNPFKDSAIWSLGHRNPQGLAWHPVTKDLFISEHGPSGESLTFGNDEINVIQKGGNYGWPDVVAAVHQKAYIDPLIVWRKATPPSGITFYHKGKLPHLENSLFIATLKSRALIRIILQKSANGYNVTAIERWFATGESEGRYGRIRDVVQGPDGYLYFLTNNRDGRGKPQENDDHIYRIMPK
jgi:quinoprotein glucose dehydrogenase